MEPRLIHAFSKKITLNNLIRSASRCRVIIMEMEKDEIVTVTAKGCKKCEYIWLPRIIDCDPKKCPKCGSYNWNKKKVPEPPSVVNDSRVMIQRKKRI